MKTNFTTGLNILKISSVFLFMLLFSIPAQARLSNESFNSSSIKLNPECKIKRMSSGQVIVFAKNEEGQEVRHEFTDLYADLLMAAYRKQRMEFIMNTISKKYYLSEEDCRREIKHAINVLAEWNIVLRDNSMANK